jgi:FixJ family two-component response regulator
MEEIQTTVQRAREAVQASYRRLREAHETLRRATAISEREKKILARFINPASLHSGGRGAKK